MTSLPLLYIPFYVLGFFFFKKKKAWLQMRNVFKSFTIVTLFVPFDYGLLSVDTFCGRRDQLIVESC